MAEPDNGAPVTPPVTPATTVEPTGSEPVTNPGGQQEQQVPFSRFQEVNDKLKSEREEREQLAQEFESFRSQFTPRGNDEDEIDPEVQRTLDAHAKKNGFVTKAELDTIRKESEQREQVQQDISDLSRELKDFDFKKVMDYAKENGNTINSKSDMKAVYNMMNHDAMIEAAKNEAIAEFTKTGSAGEAAGSSGTRPASTQQQPNTPRTRISAAMKKLNIN